MISVIVFLLFNAPNASALSPADLNSTCIAGKWGNELLMKLSDPGEHPYSGSCTYFDFEKGEILEANSNKEKLLCRTKEPEKDEIQKKDGCLNVLSQKLPDKTLSGAPVKKFFTDLRKKILEKVKQERAKTIKAQECLKSKSANECIPVTEATYSVLGLSEEDQKDYKFSDIIKDARFNLILASRPESPLWGKKRDQPGQLNVNMHDLEIYKKVRWNMSLGQETTDARGVLKNYYDDAYTRAEKLKSSKELQQKIRESLIQIDKAEDKIENAMDAVETAEKAIKALIRPNMTAADEKKVDELRKQVKTTRDTVESLQSEVADKKDTILGYRRHMDLSNIVNEKRQEHHAAYAALMGTYPIMQFIESENPDKKEIQNAIAETLKSLDDEEKWIKDITESLDEKGSLDKDLLKLMLYNSEVKEVLSENGEYCGMARDFVHLREAKNLGFDIGIYLPVMALSIVAPYTSLATRSALLYTSGFGTMATSVGVSSIKQDRIDHAAFGVVGRFNPKDSEDDMKERYQKLNELSADRDLELMFGVLGGIEIGAGLKASEQLKQSRLLRASVMKHNGKFFTNEYTVLTRKKLHGPMGRGAKPSSEN